MAKSSWYDWGDGRYYIYGQFYSMVILDNDLTIANRSQTGLVNPTDGKFPYTPRA